MVSSISESVSTRMAYSNLEQFSLVCLGVERNKSKINVDIEQRLRAYINCLKIFDNSDECEQYIDQVSQHDQIVLIVSDQLSEEFVPHVHHCQQVSSIIVFCTTKWKNKKWSQQFIKIKSVVNSLDALLTQIQFDKKIRIQNKIEESLSFTIFDRSNHTDQSTSELNGYFIHAQLLIDCLLRMKPVVTDKNELVSVCRREYQGNHFELNNVDEFERNYSADKSLWWYTRDSFLYRILNQALRTQNIDLLFLLRFFIRDISEQLKQHQCLSTIEVFRSQLMTNDELQALKDSIGELISINSFFSTSVDRKVPRFFLGHSTGVDGGFQRVLFEINLNPHLDEIKPFANITSQSYFSMEQEILIIIGSIFRLVHIYQDEDKIWIIQMKLESNHDTDSKSVFESMKNEYSDGQMSLLSFGQVLRRMGKFDMAEKYSLRLLNEMSNNQSIISDCYSNLGRVAFDRGQYDLSLEWHHKVLGMLKSDDCRLASTYIGLGCCWSRKGNVKTALEYYKKGLMISKQDSTESHLDTAMYLFNIGWIYKKEKKYIEALEYHQKALAIRQECLPPDHPSFGASYRHIGSIYFLLGQIDLGLDYNLQSLKNFDKSLPHQHTKRARTLTQLGEIYERQRNLKQSLACYKVAENIFRVVSPTHGYLRLIQDSIQRLSSQLKSNENDSDEIFANSSLVSHRDITFEDCSDL